MDHRRFDALARALSGASTRRAALAGALAALLPTAAHARPRRNGGRADDAASTACLAAGQRCGKGSGKRGKPCAKCCTRHSVAQSNGTKRCACKPAGAAARNSAQCCSGRRSVGGFCGACDPGLTECNGACVDLETDDANCGGCGNACAGGQRCAHGTCICDAASCPDGCCEGGACLGVGDPCGDAACTGGTFTPRGACAGGGTCAPGTPVSCAPYLNCDGNACASACASDADCVGGTVCAADNTCVTCIDDADCADGTVCADNTCVACGGADEPCCPGRACDGGRHCLDGACVTLPKSTCDGDYSGDGSVECGEEIGCRCTTTVGGTTFCRDQAGCVSADHPDACNADADCPDDSFCLVLPGRRCCAPICRSLTG